MHLAAKTIRFLQTMQQCFVVRRVERGGKVEQRKNGQISTVYRPKNVRQNLQERRFSKMIGATGRLKVGN